MLTRTSLISAGKFNKQCDDSNDNDSEIRRPVRTKEGKRRRIEANKMGKSERIKVKTVKISTYDISINIAKRKELMDARQKEKKSAEKKKIQLEEEKY